jgi:hypothetical protein
MLLLVSKENCGRSVLQLREHLRSEGIEAMRATKLDDWLRLDMADFLGRVDRFYYKNLSSYYSDKSVAAVWEGVRKECDARPAGSDERAFLESIIQEAEAMKASVLTPEGKLLALFTEQRDVPNGQDPATFFLNQVTAFASAKEMKALEATPKSEVTQFLFDVVRNAAKSKDEFRELVAFYTLSKAEVKPAVEKLRKQKVRLSGAKAKYTLREELNGDYWFWPGAFPEHQQPNFATAWNLLFLMPDFCVLNERKNAMVSSESGTMVSSVLLMRRAKRSNPSSEPELLQVLLMSSKENCGKSLLPPRDLLRAAGVDPARVDEWLRHEVGNFLMRVDRSVVKLSDPYYDPYVSAVWEGMSKSLKAAPADSEERRFLEYLVRDTWSAKGGK